MLYIKKEINESIDEYVVDEDNILDLIERVLGNEFRVEVESKIGDKEDIADLERIISELEDDCENLEDELNIANDELSHCQGHADELETQVDELEKELEELTESQYK